MTVDDIYRTMLDKVIKKLKVLTTKQHVVLTSRCNKSIFFALKYARQIGKTKVIIQDQGGWITYEQFATKLKFELVKVPTDFGKINPLDLEELLDVQTVVLINSLAGYFVGQKMKIISKMCKDKGALLVNDVSGSIGSELSHYGTIVVGSFGNHKPLGVGEGGFFATDSDEILEYVNSVNTFEVKDSFVELLNEKINNLERTLHRYDTLQADIKKDLKEYSVLHPSYQGINVVVLFENEDEKNRLIEYCDLHGYPYTLCPRYIRVMKDALSIEVKRL